MTITGYGVQRGDLVEFTDSYHAIYPPKDQSLIRFGVAVENESSDGTVAVMQADRTITIARHLVAFGWAGFVPPGLDPIMAEFSTVSEPEEE